MIRRIHHAVYRLYNALQSKGSSIKWISHLTSPSFGDTGDRQINKTDGKPIRYKSDRHLAVRWTGYSEFARFAIWLIGDIVDQAFACFADRSFRLLTYGYYSSHSIDPASRS